MCINDTCVNEEQLKALLAAQNGAQTASAASVPQDGTSASQGGSSSAGGDSSGTPDTTAPALVLNGPNPATVQAGATYADMGVTATDNVDAQVFVYASVDGGPTIQPGGMVTFDTTEVADHTIVFTVTDEAGNTSTATRTVHVVLPEAAPVPDPVPEPIQDPLSEPVTDVATSTSSENL